MRLVLHGGFGEKGRTSIGVESGGFRLLLDAGVKTSAHGGADYYPAISRDELAATHAIVITHGHEDHAAALGWCIANGFRGRVLATPETRRELGHSLVGYAEPAHLAFVQRAQFETLAARDTMQLGPLTISTGRSGHVTGGVWVMIDDGNTRFLYAGDVVPSSPVFAMDALPSCDALAFDASYGSDATAPMDRVREITAWVDAQAQGCVLPTPLYGRSVELLSMLRGTIALAPGMREALGGQLANGAWLVPGVDGALRERIARSRDWNEGEALPNAALICHDGMGMAGPSRAILEAARTSGQPVLFTGHVPVGSPGERMLRESLATWIRLPTHPTLPENVALAQQSRARLLFGHSCERDELESLAHHLPSLRSDVVTGDSLEL